jgi:hypothetical protein
MVPMLGFKKQKMKEARELEASHQMGVDISKASTECVDDFVANGAVAWAKEMLRIQRQRIPMIIEQNSDRPPDQIILMEGKNFYDEVCKHKLTLRAQCREFASDWLTLAHKMGVAFALEDYIDMSVDRVAEELLTKHAEEQAARINTL